jgi:hypothetical protein
MRSARTGQHRQHNHEGEAYDPHAARVRSVGVGAKANPGAAARMLSTETTMVSHRAHRLSIHSPAAAMRPATPSTTSR